MPTDRVGDGHHTSTVLRRQEVYRDRPRHGPDEDSQRARGKRSWPRTLAGRPLKPKGVPGRADVAPSGSPDRRVSTCGAEIRAVSPVCGCSAERFASSHPIGGTWMLARDCRGVLLAKNENCPERSRRVRYTMLARGAQPTPACCESTLVDPLVDNLLTKAALTCSMQKNSGMAVRAPSTPRSQKPSGTPGFPASIRRGSRTAPSYSPCQMPTSESASRHALSRWSVPQSSIRSAQSSRFAST